MNRLAVFIVAIFLLLPSGVNAEWTMFGKDANHSELNVPLESPVTFSM